MGGSNHVRNDKTGQQIEVSFGGRRRRAGGGKSLEVTQEGPVEHFFGEVCVNPMVVRMEGWTCHVSNGGMLCEAATCSFRGGPIGEVRVPEGISRLKSLQTLEGIYTGGSISKELESFSPPSLLQILKLEGRLIESPAWLGSMENLTKLPMMEEGAMPCLQYPCFRNCFRLRALPDGLQYMTTLKKLVLYPIHGNLARRLSPNGGPENYKVKHTPQLSNGVLNLEQLRHLKMFQPIHDVRLDFHKVSPASETSKLYKLYTQVVALPRNYATISTLFGMKIQFSPCLETFSPPQLLQILELTGRLLEITVWLASMENLSQLRMRCSHLSENPTTILQFLPDLKYLLTGHAYKGVSIALSHPLPP
ncbi:hypothetical protein CK203_011051 [Vitis vinifera]|uniref:Disease resistance protein n=1 Tax=Vitis vinifera TaxID=29760 RepID=A0A438JIF7_VITVI|nr:hypothetical protein CK203_011051 [Vitis vinifera]